MEIDADHLPDINDYDYLKKTGPHYYSYRFLICPENIGSAAFLSKNKTTKISSGIIPNKKKQSFLDQLLLWIRGNIFIPDARVFWVKPSVKYLEKYISENGITTIITSGPPHSLHLIGLNLNRKLNIKWVTDFRDPWTTIGYHKALKLSEFAADKMIFGMQFPSVSKFNVKLISGAEGNPE